MSYMHVILKVNSLRKIGIREGVDIGTISIDKNSRLKGFPVKKEKR